MDLILWPDRTSILPPHFDFIYEEYHLDNNEFFTPLLM